MSKLNSIPVALLFVIGGSIVCAQTRDHDITLDDYFSQSIISTMACSPDGRHVAYTEDRWQEDIDRQNTDLWVVSTATKEVRRLTFDPAGESNPQWSEDSRQIYFMTSRKRSGEDNPPYDGSRQVWRISVEGGDIFPVTRVKKGVQGFQLSTDGRTLYYLAGKKHVDPDAWKNLREEFSDLEYGQGVVTFGRIWKLDLQTWRSEMIIDDDRVIGEFVVSPDERRIAMITTPTEELITNEGWSKVDVYDSETGRITSLEDHRWRAEAPSPFGWIVNLAWSSNGNKLAFRVDFDGYPGEMFIAHFNRSETQISQLSRPWEVTVEGQMTWKPRTYDLCFIASDHARQRLYRIPNIQPGGHGAGIIMTPGDEVINAFSYSRRDSKLTVLRSGRTHTPDLFRLHNPGSEATFERITNINPQVDTWKLPQISIVKWKSHDGTEVEGILELPPDYKPGDGPLPTVVTIHGGPTASSKYEFRYWIYGRTAFAAKGWAVFDPNYRGSTGYGDKFLIDLIENKNNLDVQDILSGVDMLVERGIADPERLSVTGWSNGGYLTNCLIVATDRFKAASSGAGVFDTVMQWSIEDTPGHVVNYSGGLPWESAAKMHASSPLYNVNRVVTPTLIHVGENDARVPAQHSRALHRALKHYLEIPTELLVYPGEGHGLTKLSHRKAKLKWDHEWFDYYVLGKSTADE